MIDIVETLTAAGMSEADIAAIGDALQLACETAASHEADSSDWRDKADRWRGILNALTFDEPDSVPGVCSQCAPGHDRGDGRCVRHGKLIDDEDPRAYAG
jgi:hypothetical protein